MNHKYKPGEVFMHDFGKHGKMEAAHHLNPDGSKGGIVAVSSTVSKTTYVDLTAVIFPNCTVYYESRIDKHAVIESNTYIGAWVVIEQCAQIGSECQINDYCHVGGSVSIGHKMQFPYSSYVPDFVHLTHDCWYTFIGPQGSRKSILTAVWNPERDVHWYTGCQRGITTKILMDRIINEHAYDPQHREDYLHVVEMILKHPGLARAKKQHEINQESKRHGVAGFETPRN